MIVPTWWLIYCE